MPGATEALSVAMRHGMEYTGLRSFQPDARLFHYVPQALAVREGVVPIVVVGDELKVASSRPDPDLSLVRARFPHLRVGVVIAPEQEIADALRRLATAR